MRFIQYLTEDNLSEAPAYIQKPGDIVNMPHNYAKGKHQKPHARAANANDIKTLVPVPPEMKPILAAAKGDRQKALELITLLGAMYQTKRVNPEAQLSVPKLVSQSKNRELLQKLFDLAKEKELPDLAAMSQEIKRSAATASGGQQPAAGIQNVPQTPGQTPAGKSVLQKLLNLIKGGEKNLSPADYQVVQKELDKAKQTARPNPTNNPQQPIGKPVVTQG